jgi:hypothetical protein
LNGFCFGAASDFPDEGRLEKTAWQPAESGSLLIEERLPDDLVKPPQVFTEASSTVKIFFLRFCWGITREWGRTVCYVGITDRRFSWLLSVLAPWVA